MFEIPTLFGARSGRSIGVLALFLLLWLQTSSLAFASDSGGAAVAESSASTAPDSASDERASAAARSVIEDEITVTAQRREQKLSEVPMAVTAFDGEQTVELQMPIVRDLASFAPNVQIESAWGGSSNPTIFLRGVGVDDVNPTADGAVAVYADETYLSAPSRRVLQLFDLERVEVLRGPQGTLYGRNTTAGAIRLLTRAPGDMAGGDLRLRAGRFDERVIEAAADLPLPGQNNALRLALIDHRRDGLTRNRLDGSELNDIEMRSARLRARFLPRDDLSIELQVRGGLDRSGFAAPQMRGLIDGANIFGYAESPDRFEVAYDQENTLDFERLGASASVHWSSDALSLTSVTAWERSDGYAVADADASPIAMLDLFWNDAGRQISQELRLASTEDSGMDWILGGFYIEEDLEVDNLWDFFPALRSADQGFDPAKAIFVARQSYTQETRSFAAFADATWPLSDRLALRIGLRNTWETREIDFDNAFEEPGVFIPLVDESRRIEDSQPSGGIGLDWAPRENLRLYANLRQGFKSGGFNGGTLLSAQELSAVEPELVTSFEAGLRVHWLGGKLSLGLTGFHYDYRDMQVYNFVNAGGVFFQVLDNAAEATVEGLELEWKARPDAATDLTLRLGLLDAKYDRFVQSNGDDFSGNRLILSPRWTLSGHIGRSWTSSIGQWSSVLGFSARDDVFFDPTNNPEIGAEGHVVLDGRLAWSPSTDSRWRVSLWAENLADESYVTEVIDVSSFGLHKVYWGDPRTYGVELELRF